MTAIRSTHVLVDLGAREGLVALPRRRRDGALARLLSRRLDDRLAAGEQPESNRLLAVRAAQLTSPQMRGRIARAWDELAERAGSPQSFDPRAPLARARVSAASDQIHHVADLLRSERAVSAEGVAIASTLLTSADSPAYRAGGVVEDIAAAVADAIMKL